MDWIWNIQDLTIWEPAAGEGILARALIARGFHVVCSDIETHPLQYQFPLDFLTEQMPYHYDCIVTNPPFSLKYEWLERCYDLGKPFALLLPLETLGSVKAQALFREYGKPAVILMSPRVDFKMPDAGWLGGGAQFPTAWFLGSDIVEPQDVGRFFIHRLDKTDKQVLHDLDEAGNL